jgi:hypothetical protein
MFRPLLRLGVLATALVSALAFSGSALAAPSTPVLKPIAPVIFSTSLKVEWFPSAFDRGALFTGYNVFLSDTTAGTLAQYGTTGTSLQLVNLKSGHKYVVRVRALEVMPNLQAYVSSSAFDVFTVLPLFVPDLYWEEIRFPPDPPWCLTCPPFDILFQDDPVLRLNRARIQVVDTERVLGVTVDPRGLVTPIHG